MRAVPVLVAACAAGGLLAGGIAAPEAMTLSGRSVLEEGHVSNLFPGYAGTTPDRFTTLSLSTTARAGHGLKLEWQAGAQLNRYDRWPARDSERYETALRARAGRFKVRTRARYSPEVLLFPDAAGGARYRGREGEVGLSVRFAGNLEAAIDLRGEKQRYDVHHPERTQDRTGWSYSLAVAPKEGPRARLEFGNERALATDSNYDFYENAITLSGETDLGRLHLTLETEQGIRNYFPASLFRTNYRRHDRVQAYRLRIDRPLTGAVDLSMSGEFRTRDSTRPDKSFDQNTLRMALDMRIPR